MVEKYGIFGNFILENNLVELSHNETFVWQNIIVGMIDQLRGGGDWYPKANGVTSALNPFPGFTFYALQ